MNNSRCAVVLASLTISGMGRCYAVAEPPTLVDLFQLAVCGQRHAKDSRANAIGSHHWTCGGRTYEFT